MPSNDKSYKTFVLFVIGSFLVVLGTTLILIWWKDVVSLFKGALGIIFALAGLIVFYYLRKQ